MKRDERLVFLQKLKAENSPETIMDQLPIMLADVKELLAKVTLAPDKLDAVDYFDQLQEIHETLSNIAFVKWVPLDKELGKFLVDCERLDDDIMRDIIFQELKTGQYHLASGISLRGDIC